MVQVTLRKANQLEKQALAASLKIAVTPTAVLSVYGIDKIEATIRQTRDKFNQSVKDVLALQETAFTIRRLIGEENVRIGINGLLSEKAELEKKERLLTGFKTKDTTEVEDTSALEVITEKLKAMKSRLDQATRLYGIEEQLAVSVLTAADIEALDDQLIAISDRKNAINDELMQKNWQAKVDLPKEVVDVLKRHKITVAS